MSIHYYKIMVKSKKQQRKRKTQRKRHTSHKKLLLSRTQLRKGILQMIGGNIPPPIETGGTSAEVVTRALDAQQQQHDVTNAIRNTTGGGHRPMYGGNSEVRTVPEDSAAIFSRNFGPDHVISGTESQNDLYGSTWQLQPQAPHIPIAN